MLCKNIGNFQPNCTFSFKMRHVSSPPGARATLPSLDCQRIPIADDYMEVAGSLEPLLIKHMRSRMAESAESGDIYSTRLAQYSR